MLNSGSGGSSKQTAREGDGADPARGRVRSSHLQLAVEVLDPPPAHALRRRHRRAGSRLAARELAPPDGRRDAVRLWRHAAALVLGTAGALRRLHAGVRITRKPLQTPEFRLRTSRKRRHRAKTGRSTACARRRRARIRNADRDIGHPDALARGAAAGIGESAVAARVAAGTPRLGARVRRAACGEHGPLTVALRGRRRHRAKTDRGAAGSGRLRARVRGTRPIQDPGHLASRPGCHQAGARRGATGSR